jgi:Glycosyl transferase family 2
MARRAVEAFRAQTYERKYILVFDTTQPFRGESYVSDLLRAHRDKCIRAANGYSIGTNRNLAIEHEPHAEIIIHFDDDDVSHPSRIAEQVALLQSSGADAVGYRELLFWRTLDMGPDNSPPGQAWLHTKRHGLPFAFGTSLCYWRKTWERKPFPDLPKNPHGSGEDFEWIKGLKLESVSSMRQVCCGEPLHEPPCWPRMIASIHAGNSSGAYDLEYLLAHGNQEWQRAPEWDDWCRERMKL